VPLGDEFFVRFAWSEPAACFVRREASVLAALAQPPAVPFLPTVVASGTGPLIVVTRRVRGSSLFDVAGSIDRDHAGQQLARFLAALHSDETRRRAEAVIGPVPAWYPLVTTGALRKRFGRWVTPGQQRAVVRWCDWADQILAGPRRVMAWHIRQALGDALWRSEAGLPLPDHRTPSDWVADLAARFRSLG
jgi:hypothetical protein